MQISSLEHRKWDHCFLAHHVESCCISYSVARGDCSSQAAHKLEDREQLMGFLRKNPEGTHLGQVKDAYPGVAADIARLQKEVG